MRAKNAALMEAVETLQRKNLELDETRHRLQLGVDILKKADGLLNKKRRASI